MFILILKLMLTKNHFHSPVQTAFPGGKNGTFKNLSEAKYSFNFGKFSKFVQKLTIVGYNFKLSGQIPLTYYKIS